MRLEKNFADSNNNVTSFNTYQFKTEGLMKPYQIKLPAIIIEKKFSDSDSTVYQLDLPSLNELTDKSHSLMIDGFKVNILSLMLTEIN